jgi:hypothetical protein
MLIKATLPVMKNIQDGLGKLDHRISSTTTDTKSYPVT